MYAKFCSHTILYNYLSMKNRKRFYTYHEILSIASCSVQWYDDKLLPTTFQPHKWNNRGAPLSERTIECGLSFFTIDIFLLKLQNPLFHSQRSVNKTSSWIRRQLFTHLTSANVNNCIFSWNTFATREEAP